MQYAQVISTPRYEDFHIEYMHQNPWAHMGLGEAMGDVKKGADLTPYLQLENIDPKWLAAMGSKDPAEATGGGGQEHNAPVGSSRAPGSGSKL